MDAIISFVVGLKSYVIFAIVLGILITVHEWGHFITARLVGVGVERFSIGFGKVLFSRKHKGTEFSISLIPLGGYVKLLGDVREECKGGKDEFLSAQFWRKALIVCNGSLVNYLFAFLCFVIVFMAGYQDLPAKVGGFIEGSSAQEAGLKVGDDIKAVNSVKIFGFEDLVFSLLESTGKETKLTVLRNGEQKDIYFVPMTRERVNIFGQKREELELDIQPYIPNTIGDVISGSPASEAGLRPGDKIISIDGKKTDTWTSISKSIKESEGKSIKVDFLQDGTKKTAYIVPKIEKIEDGEGNLNEIRTLGIVRGEIYSQKSFGIISSIRLGFRKLIQITKLTYSAIYWMLTRAMSAKGAAGPVGIFMVVKSASEVGISRLIYWVGSISASLAIFNMLPVVPLDGGHLFLFAIEKLRGRPLPEKVEEWVHKIGFGLIIALALFIFYNDFVNIGLIDKLIGLFYKLKVIIVGS